MRYRSILCGPLERFAQQLQHEREAIRRNPVNVKPTKKRLVYLIESLAHLTSLEKIRDDVLLYIDTVLNGDVAAAARLPVNAEPLIGWAREYADHVRYADASTSQTHFTMLQSHLAKLKLIEFSQDCLENCAEPNSDIARSVQLYKTERRRITGKGGLGGGTGNEDETIIKQIAANEFAGILPANYFTPKGTSDAVKVAIRSLNNKLTAARPIAEIGQYFGPGVFMLLPEGSVTM